MIRIQLNSKFLLFPKMSSLVGGGGNVIYLPLVCYHLVPLLYGDPLPVFLLVNGYGSKPGVPPKPLNFSLTTAHKGVAQVGAGQAQQKRVAPGGGLYRPYSTSPTPPAQRNHSGTKRLIHIKKYYVFLTRHR